MKIFTALKALFIKSKDLETRLDNLHSDSIEYQTTEPTADNDEGLKFVVLDHEPATKYNGYVYYIVESQQAQGE